MREAPLAPLFQLHDLTIAFDGASVVDRLSLTVKRGETLALVGESGSGKSVSALGAMNLLPPNARIEGGRRLGDTDLATLSDNEEWQRKLRGGYSRRLTGENRALEKMAVYVSTHPASEERALELRRLARERGWDESGTTTPF